MARGFSHREPGLVKTFTSDRAAVILSEAKDLSLEKPEIPRAHALGMTAGN